MAIAPGHRPEGKVYVELLGHDVRKARVLAASGKNDGQVWFVDLNTGNKFLAPESDHLQAPAAAIPQIIDWILSIAAKN